ncbi:GGDEF domain-containing protein [Vibrio aquaticus]|uniref:diguanylate cyclase n=1 Tax=Vibrio aquaticus TaxID=2496559 RepID=A0A3S0MM47_9VIBR|nr:GGDEF domain-containing protein [Vibrio aquaticus]RTZ14525.1 GGDEF domain-containing protein [Vibrio aquaticus]
MKRQFARTLSIILAAALTPSHTLANNHWQEWEQAYNQVAQQSDTRALAMLQDRYSSLAPGIEKLYVSSKLHGFMTLKGQPFHGHQLAFNEEYSSREQQFISALNSENKLEFRRSTEKYTQLLNHSNLNNDIQGKILFEYHLCRSLNKQGQYHKANLYCSSLQTHLSDTSSTILPRYQAVRVIANNLEYLGDYQSALEHYQKYLSILPSNVDPSGVYNDAGLLLMNLGQLKQAEEYLNVALKIRNENNSQLELAQAHHSMGTIQLAAQDYSNAKHHFTQAKLILTNYNHEYGLTYALLGLGNTYSALEQYEKSRKLLLDSLEFASIQGNDQIRGEIYLSLAQTHHLQGNHILAISFADKALTLGKRIKSVNLQAEALISKATFTEANNNFQSALELYKQYTELELSKRKVQNQSAYLALESAEREYSLDAKHKETLAENQVQQDQIDNLTSLNHLYLFALGSLTLLFILYAFLIRSRSRKAEHDHLTGALNRAASIREIKQVQAVSNPEHRHLLILLDLDDFKKINDSYGHPTGDRALSNIAHVINEKMDTGDIFGRLGGEEFIVVVRDIDELDVASYIDKLHQSIGDSEFEAENKEKLNVTASLSYIATTKSLSDFDELYSILDQALYQAKQSGKNCTIDAFNDPIYLPASAYAPIEP